jgi:hypothetical protein
MAGGSIFTLGWTHLEDAVEYVPFECNAEVLDA